MLSRFLEQVSPFSSKIYWECLIAIKLIKTAVPTRQLDAHSHTSPVFCGLFIVAPRQLHSSARIHNLTATLPTSCRKLVLFGLAKNKQKSLKLRIVEHTPVIEEKKSIKLS